MAVHVQPILLRIRKPLTLGTAMAVSGAAMSPTAGRTTHPIRAFILGLLNARLGLWVGNPSSPSTVSQESPPLTGWAVLSEVLGIRAKFTSWIHLSDGGHFENLGVYELLRRGCSRIVVVDGSCDPKGYMADLANLIRRARIDLGIIVRNPEAADFGADLGSRWSDAGPLALDSDDRDGTAEGSWRWFTVDYGQDMPLGRLLYIKPSAVGRADLPIEVRQYWKRSPAFPHETTADQFFTEAQMEAYRSLGQADGERALQTVLQIKRARSPQVDRGLLNALLRQAVRSPASGGSA